MSKVSISTAARLSGKSRQTLYKHRDQGRLTVERDAEGNPVVDTSELIRVYGSIQADNTDTVNVRQVATAENDSVNSALQVEVKMLRELLDEKDKRILDLQQAMRLIEYKVQEKPQEVVATKPKRRKIFGLF